MFQVLVVGAGYFSQFHLDSWQRIEGVKLAAIVELNASKRKQLATSFPQVRLYSDLVEALQQLSADIVDIVTPPASHFSIVQSVFTNTGENTLVICQKPFCSSLSEAKELAHSASRLNRKLVVHENFRFQPWYAKIKQMLENGDIGDMLQANFRLRPGDGRGPSAYLERQPYFQSMPRFLIHETGIHWVDTFRYLFGEPSTVYADLRRINPAIAGEDAGIVVFGYASGSRVTLDANRHLDHAAQNKRLTMGELWVEGSEATLRLDGEGRLFLRAFAENEEQAVTYQFQNQGFAGDAVHRLNQHIVEHLVAQSALSNLAVDYLRNLQLEQRIYEAANKNMRLSCSPTSDCD